MRKNFLEVLPRRRNIIALRKLETGFSMLEAVVVVGVLLALAVTAFFAYGPITENAKNAKVKAAASEVHTAVVVASVDGDSTTKPQDVLDAWNDSTDEILVEILKPEDGGTRPNGDFCIQATDLTNPSITAQAGTCSDVIDDGELPGEELPDPPARPAVMKTTWNTSIAADYGLDCEGSITLPLTGEVDATVDWGDGTVEHFTTELPEHPYGTPGEKNIVINGTFTGWVGEDWPDWSSDCITKVTEWGETGTTDLEGGFYASANLTDIPQIPSTATKMAWMFNDAINFNADISDWNTSNVTDMSYMFEAAESFNQNIGGWNTSNVKNMHAMFNLATSFNQDISNWNTSQVTDMGDMFRWNEIFNQPVGKWDTSKVTDMSSMFLGNVAFDQDLSLWITSSVTDMNYMFYKAETFNQPIGEWITSNVTDMSYMFSGAKVFDQPIGDWDTSNVTDMSYMFYEATAFNQPINTWVTSNVSGAGASGLFSNATSFNQPLDKWDLTKATFLGYMFYEATNFDQDLSGWGTAGATYESHFSMGSALSAEHLPPGAPLG